MQFRPATLEERKEFYKNEFKPWKLRFFFKKKPQLLAIDAGTDTKIAVNKDDIGSIFYLKYNELKEMIEEYAPEDIYYDRNIYVDSESRLKHLNKKVFGTKEVLGQELCFDIDPENVKCSCKSKYPLFCVNCLKTTIKLGIQLSEKLKENFKKIKLVYTGRGCHVHVFGKEAYTLTIKERKEINIKLKKYSIDPWVSEGHIHLIRLPYSLNGLVSRIVIPLTIKEANKFDPVNDKKVIPKYLKN